MIIDTAKVNRELSRNFPYNPESIADTILAQLGGNRFLVMTGTKDLIWDGEKSTLTMSLARNASKANRLDITYSKGLDSYTMRFYRYTAPRWSNKTYSFTDAKVTEVKAYSDIYWDQLEELFMEATGLYTRF